MRTTIASLISLILVLSILLQNCQKTYEPPCGQIQYKFSFLSYDAKSKVPYRQEKFDIISFASDKGDTLVFIRQTLDSGSTCFPQMNRVSCPPNYTCAEYYGSDYACIKGQGKFSFIHGRALSIVTISIVTNNPFYENIEYPDVIEFRFNETHIMFFDNIIDDKTTIRYIGDTTIRGTVFHNCIYSFHEFKKSDVAKGYYNKEFGLFHIQDKKNNKNWTIIKN